MLTICFQCCATGAETCLGSVAKLHIDGDSLHLPGHGFYLTHRDGYWRNAESGFLSGRIEKNASLCFENDADRSAVYGPFDQIHFFSGYIWVTEDWVAEKGGFLDERILPGRQLIARFDDQSRNWSDFVAREWPRIRIATSEHSLSPLGEPNHVNKRSLK